MILIFFKVFKTKGFHGFLEFDDYFYVNRNDIIKDYMKKIVERNNFKYKIQVYLENRENIEQYGYLSPVDENLTF